MVIFGGQNELNQSNNKIWIYNFMEQTWKIKYPDIQIESLDSHAAVVHEKEMYVFGGFNDKKAEYSNSLYAMDLETFKWRVLFDGKTGNEKASIAPRAGMSLVYYDHYLWIFGGNNINLTFDDFWKFDLNKLLFTKV